MTSQRPADCHSFALGLVCYTCTSPTSGRTERAQPNPDPLLPPPQTRGLPKLGSRSHSRMSPNQTTIGQIRGGSLSLILAPVQRHGKMPFGLSPVCSQWLEKKHLIKFEVISGTQLRMKHAAAPAWFLPLHSRPDKTAFSGTQCNSHHSRHWHSKVKNTNSTATNLKIPHFFFLHASLYFFFSLTFTLQLSHVPLFLKNWNYHLWSSSNDHIYIYIYLL